MYHGGLLPRTYGVFNPAAPGAIGGTTPAAGTFTTVQAAQYNIGSSSTQMVEAVGGYIGVRGVTANNAGNIRKFGANGGYVDWASSSELLTLNTGGTTTDSAADLLPVNSYIEAVTGRVTTTITVATSWALGDPTTAGRFAAANAVMTAGSTSVGLVHSDQTGAAGPKQLAAAKVRVTTVGTPGAGAIRLTSFFRQFIAPTS